MKEATKKLGISLFIEIKKHLYIFDSTDKYSKEKRVKTFPYHLCIMFIFYFHCRNTLYENLHNLALSSQVTTTKRRKDAYLDLSRVILYIQTLVGLRCLVCIFIRRTVTKYMAGRQLQWKSSSPRTILTKTGLMAFYFFKGTQNFSHISKCVAISRSHKIQKRNK